MSAFNIPRPTSSNSGRRYTLTERVTKFKELNPTAGAMDQLNFYKQISPEYNSTDSTVNPSSSSSSSTALTNLPRGSVIPPAPTFALPHNRPALPVMESGGGGQLTHYTTPSAPPSQAMTPYNQEQSLDKPFTAPAPHTQADILRALETYDAGNVGGYAREEALFTQHVNGGCSLDDNQKMNLRRLKPEFLPRLGEVSGVAQYARNGVLNGFFVSTPAEQNFYNQITRSFPLPTSLFGNI